MKKVHCQSFTHLDHILPNSRSPMWGIFLFLNARIALDWSFLIHLFIPIGLLLPLWPFGGYLSIVAPSVRGKKKKVLFLVGPARGLHIAKFQRFFV